MYSYNMVFASNGEFYTVEERWHRNWGAGLLIVSATQGCMQEDLSGSNMLCWLDGS